MRQMIKQAFLRLPGVRRLAAQRDRLADQCRRLHDEIAQQRKSTERIAIERDQLKAHLSRLDQERREFENLCGQMATHQEALEAVNVERDELKIHCSRLEDERLEFKTRCDELSVALLESSAQVERIHAEFLDLQRRQGSAPAGHFYSPIPDLDDIAAREQEIFGSLPESLPGIDLRADEQLQLLRRFESYYNDLPFTPEATQGLRYHYENPAYSYSDAIMLHCMIRYLEPRRIIEIGSGHSSCVILDTNDRFFDGAIEATFIEPYPELLHDLLEPEDLDRVRIIDRPVQEVSLETFGALGKNDILFVDSTHVGKVGSDVNRILFDILPRLDVGVHIHFHDITYPFEYPKEWVFEGRAWNETYLLRTFLSFNREFRVLLMNTYMQHRFPDFFEQHMPLCLRNPGGSIWIRRDHASPLIDDEARL